MNRPIPLVPADRYLFAILKVLHFSIYRHIQKLSSDVVPQSRGQVLGCMINLLRARSFHTFPETFMGRMLLVDKSEKMEINNIFPECVKSFAGGLWDRVGVGMLAYLKKMGGDCFG